MFIAIDFDGTIAQNRFPAIGPAVPGAFEWMKKFQDAGAKLFLWTMRCDDRFVEEYKSVLTEAVKFCSDNGIVFHGINRNTEFETDSPKLYASIYIDDRAYGCPILYDETGQPMVDWSMVGPNVLIKIYERLAQSEKRA